MSEEQKQNATVQTAGLPPVLPFQLRLRSLKSTRQTFARLLREYGKGRVPESLYKNLIWGLGGLITAFKEEREESTAKKLEAVEERLERLEA